MKFNIIYVDVFWVCVLTSMCTHSHTTQYVVVQLKEEKEEEEKVAMKGPLTLESLPLVSCFAMLLSMIVGSRWESTLTFWHHNWFAYDSHTNWLRTSTIEIIYMEFITCEDAKYRFQLCGCNFYVSCIEFYFFVVWNNIWASRVVPSWVIPNT